MQFVKRRPWIASIGAAALAGVLSAALLFTHSAGRARAGIGGGDSNGQVSVANTARDGTGTLVTIYTAGSAGSTVSRVEVIATGTTTAGMIRLFIYDGTNNRLWTEIPVTAITPSGTVQAFAGNTNPSPSLPLKSGWLLKASTHNAETFNVRAYGMDL